MISRVADYCFWLGRYIERAESTARLLEATRSLEFDAGVPIKHCWQPLIIVSGQQAAFLEHYELSAMGDSEVVQRYMTWAPENQVSLATSLRSARECARVIRDTLSRDVWEEINGAYVWLGSPETEKLYEGNRDEVFRAVRRSTQLSLGLVRSTMLHDLPMSFLWLGVMLERVGQTARILDMHHHTLEGEPVHSIVQNALWLSLLRACSGYESFMRKSRGRVTAQRIVSFLVFEPNFPRSLLYCLRSADRTLRIVWPARAEGGPLRDSQVRLRALLDWLDKQHIAPAAAQVHALLTHIVDEVSEICAHIGAEIQGPARAEAGSHAC